MEAGAALTWTLVVAIVLAAVHVTAPTMRRFLDAHALQLGSFGSGLAIAYVFVHLLVELDTGHTILAERIHLVVLVGFVLFYAVEHSLDRNVARSELDSSRRFILPLVTSWTYSWLIIYALPQSLSEGGAGLIAPVIALVLHTAFADHHLCKEHRAAFDRWGRWALATAPLAGWVTDLFFFADEPAVSTMLIALLAGSVLYNVLRRELPDHAEASLPWFIAGAVVYVLLDLILG